MHKPTKRTRALAYKLAAVGINKDLIAAKIGISKVTLLKYYDEELAEALVECNTKICGSIMRSALEGNMTAAIWWDKTRNNMKEGVNIETRQVDKDGDDIHPHDLKVFENLEQRIIQQHEAQKKKEEENS